MTPELQNCLGVAACIVASGFLIYCIFCGLAKLNDE